MSKRIPVLVVEDNRLVRDGIIAMLAEQQDLKVVGAVDRAPAALERARERALEFVAEAKNILTAIPLSDNQRGALTLVADGVVERYS